MATAVSNNSTISVNNSLNPREQRGKERLTRKKICAEILEKSAILHSQDELDITIRQLFINFLLRKYTETNDTQLKKDIKNEISIIINVSTIFQTPTYFETNPKCPSSLAADPTMEKLWKCSQSIKHNGICTERLSLLDYLCKDILEDAGKGGKKNVINPQSDTTPLSKKVKQIQLMLDSWKNSEAIAYLNSFNSDEWIKKYDSDDAEAIYSSIRVFVKRWNKFYDLISSKLQKIKNTSSKTLKEKLLLDDAANISITNSAELPIELIAIEEKSKVQLELNRVAYNNPFLIRKEAQHIMGKNSSDDSITMVLKSSITKWENIRFASLHLCNLTYFLCYASNVLQNEADAIRLPSALHLLSHEDQQSWLQKVLESKKVAPKQPARKTKKQNHSSASTATTNCSSSSRKKRSRHNKARSPEKVITVLSLCSLQRNRTRQTFFALKSTLLENVSDSMYETVQGCLKQCKMSLGQARSGFEWIHTLFTKNEFKYIPQATSTLIFDLHSILEQLISCKYILTHNEMPSDHHLSDNARDAQFQNLSNATTTTFSNNSEGTYYLRYPQSSLNEYADKLPTALSLIAQTKNLQNKNAEEQKIFLAELERTYYETMAAFDELTAALTQKDYVAHEDQKATICIKSFTLKSSSSSHQTLLSKASNALSKWNIEKFNQNYYFKELIENVLTHLAALEHISTIETSSPDMVAKLNRDCLLHFQTAMELLLRLLSIKELRRNIVKHDFTVCEKFIKDASILAELNKFSLGDAVRYPMLHMTCASEQNPWIKQLVEGYKYAASVEETEAGLFSVKTHSKNQPKAPKKNLLDEVYASGVNIIDYLVKALTD